MTFAEDISFNGDFIAKDPSREIDLLPGAITPRGMAIA